MTKFTLTPAPWQSAHFSVAPPSLPPRPLQLLHGRLRLTRNFLRVPMNSCSRDTGSRCSVGGGLLQTRETTLSQTWKTTLLRHGRLQCSNTADYTTCSNTETTVLKHGKLQCSNTGDHSVSNTETTVPRHGRLQCLKHGNYSAQTRETAVLKHGRLQFSNTGDKSAKHGRLQCSNTGDSSVSWMQMDYTGRHSELINTINLHT